MPKAKEKHNCAGKVFSGGSVFSSACSRNGSLFEDGCWWCASHAPSKKKARAEASSKKFHDEWALRDAKYHAQDRYSDAQDALLKAARGAVTGDDLSFLDEAITKLDKCKKRNDEAYRAWKKAISK